MPESYGQHAEDRIIFNQFAPGFRGVVTEIGAFDPSAFSNSRLFIEAGWTAHLYEFSPGPLRNLVKFHGDNPNVWIYAGAVSTHRYHEELQFGQFSITDDALSTDNAAHRQLWATSGGYFGKMCVPLIPASVAAQTEADFLSVDTEGSSVDILAAYLGSAFKLPLAICIEHNCRYGEIGAMREKYGYDCIHHPPSAGENILLWKRGA